MSQEKKPQKFDVFLSHNSKDKPTVRRLGEALRSRGLRVWLDEWELPPGWPWQEKVEEIIETTRSAAVLVGKDGLGPWGKREMRALIAEFVDRELPVIPVLLPGASAKPKLPIFLKQFTWVDLRKGIRKKGLDRLIWGIKGEKPTAEPLPADDDSPSAGFPVHNLPFESLGPLFKGRDERLRALASSPDQPTAIIQKQKQAIHGLGGIGKTRLAIEYAWQYGSRYEAILFVPADSPEELRRNLTALARADLLDLPERQLRDEQEVIGAVLRWLRQNPDWLLILDNVDTEEAAQAVQELLPVLTEGHVLVTSRLLRWSTIREQLSLDTISAEAGRDFLLERTAGEREPAADDADQARDLAETLDGLPLALQQAAAYIAILHLSFSKYRAEWDADRARVLDCHDSREMQYPTSVAVTWQRSFEELGPASQTILRLAAFLAPDPIPVAMFEEADEIVSEAQGASVRRPVNCRRRCGSGTPSGMSPPIR
ncbi:MAG: TIR domain-containing protein [bacterium]|nr:TIR domain-containing protein [bacterium]